MSTYYIYTDASVKCNEYSICGVIVKDSHIIDIYYRHRFAKVKSTYAERMAIIKSYKYVNKKYNASNIICYSDCKCAISNPYKEISLKYVKGHCGSRKGFKYKYNCLADFIAKNGLNKWRIYWYAKL